MTARAKNKITQALITSSSYYTVAQFQNIFHRDNSSKRYIHDFSQENRLNLIENTQMREKSRSLEFIQKS